MTEKDDYRNNNHPTVDGGGKVKFESGSKWSQFNSNVQYAAFCEKYASILIGQRKLQEYYKTHPGKGLFHKLHHSDEAYVLLIIRNNQRMWIHQCNEKDEREQNSSSPQKSTKKRKKSRPNSRKQGDDEVPEETVDATVSLSPPKPLWTGYKSGSKITYLSSGWREEGELFFKTLERYCGSRTKEETEELNRVWADKFGTKYKTVDNSVRCKTLPGLPTSDDDSVSIPSVDLHCDSDNEDLDSLSEHIDGDGDGGEGEGEDGMVGDPDNLNIEPV